MEYKDLTFGIRKATRLLIKWKMGFDVLKDILLMDTTYFQF